MPDEDVPRGYPAGFAASQEDRLALVVLSALRGISPRAIHRLAWRERTARGCVAAIRAGRAGTAGDHAFVDTVDPAAILETAAACGARFLATHDEEFPRELDDLLADPPSWLFVRGRRLNDRRPRVSVVGSRRCSALGREIAFGLGRGLAAAGLCVVSGAAYGIDAAAHLGALAAGGRTIAVLGSGIDVGYPRASADLIERIAVDGTVVSEYPPGTPAEPHRFPARNRVVAALSRGLVVVEGAAGSGSRISVDHALDLGRDVFAVPGPLTSPLSEVPLELIREGATLIRGVDDLLLDLGIETPVIDEPEPPVELGEDERRVWSAVQSSSLPDAVARQAGMSIPDAVSTLIRLELRGLVRNVGGRYERTFAGVGTR